MLKILMMHGICLSGLLGIHLNLRRLVVFLDIHFLILCALYARSHYAPFWCDLCNSTDLATNSYPYYACYDQFNFASPMDNTDVVLTL